MITLRDQRRFALYIAFEVLPEISAKTFSAFDAKTGAALARGCTIALLEVLFGKFLFTQSLPEGFGLGSALRCLG